MIKQLEACKKAALVGGQAITNINPKKLHVGMKGTDELGHHAVVTNADERSQKAIFEILKRTDPEALFIAEEAKLIKDAEVRKRLITNANIQQIKEKTVFLIDPLDGTSPFIRNLELWSVSICVARNLEHTAGVVFAPHAIAFPSQDVRGVLFYGSAGAGSFVEYRKTTTNSSGSVSSRKVTAKAMVSKITNLEDAYIMIGQDCLLSDYPMHNIALPRIADNSRTVGIPGSCALGLGRLAIGSIDAIIQPLHYPWDWAAGKVIVEQAGGVFFFYEMPRGRIKPITTLEPRHYSPKNREIGFVAACNRIIGERIMELLLETG